jgi:hypothetical protein
MGAPEIPMAHHYSITHSVQMEIAPVCREAKRRPLQIQFDPCIHAATPTMGLFVSAACGIAAQRIGGLQNRDCDRVF